MKLLIISHNPLSTSDSMGKTLASLLSAFSPSDLCQFYIYPTIPNTDKCTAYYRITDKDVLKSYYKFRVNGAEISPDLTQRGMFEKAGDEALYRNPKNKSAPRVLLRDIMWKCAYWYNKGLKNWLDAQRPDCIFLAPGPAKFIYNIALKISEKYNIPIVTYICDEYYFVDTPKTFGKRLQVNLLQKKIRKTLSKTAQIITICNELEDLYGTEFNKPTTTVMTSSSFPIVKETHLTEHPTTITYLGNVRCKRYVSLEALGKTLEAINKKQGTHFSIHIYTAEKDEKILGRLSSCKAIKLCGFVSGDEFDKVLHSAEILLHTESFEKQFIELVKNSVSTKIPDSLASGVPLLAYGPSSLASMQHLIRNKCAYVITEDDDVENALLDMLEGSTEKRREYFLNALQVAESQHNSEVCSQHVKEIIKKVATQC